jgi:hypothetical protein
MDGKKSGVGDGVRPAWATAASAQASQNPVVVPVISMGKRRQRREKLWAWVDKADVRSTSGAVPS